MLDKRKNVRETRMGIFGKWSAVMYGCAGVLFLILKVLFAGQQFPVVSYFFLGGFVLAGAIFAGIENAQSADSLFYTR